MSSSQGSQLTKLSIIEHHLIASIQMISLKMSPITTHVVVMACEEMAQSLAVAQSIFLDTDYRIYIKEEFHSEYRRHVRRPYNFFKHADNDPHAIYEGPSLDDLINLNEILTLMNGRAYFKLGGSGPFDQIVNLFAVTMMIKRPRLFKDDWLGTHPALKREFEEVKKHPEYAEPALRQHLYQANLLPEIPYRGAILS